jgi:hypothetical protein
MRDSATLINHLELWWLSPRDDIRCRLLSGSVANGPYVHDFATFPHIFQPARGSTLFLSYIEILIIVIYKSFKGPKDILLTYA